MTFFSRAPEQELAALHGAFARFLADRLKSGEATGPELNCIRQFLKDNGIDCVGRDNPDIHDITANLPTFDDTGEDDANLLN